MKKFIYKIIPLLYLSFMVSSCDLVDYKTPLNPENEKVQEEDKKDEHNNSDDHNHSDDPNHSEEHHHDEVEFTPAKIELLVVDGHMHGTTLFHETLLDPKLTFMAPQKKMTFVKNTNNQWELTEDSSKKIIVKGGNQNQKEPLWVYGVWIKYYDSEGKEITNVIGENPDEFQHFFEATNIRPTFDGKKEITDQLKLGSKELFEYHYRDSNPWNQTLKDKAEHLWRTNPVGLKGFLSFGYPRVEMDLHVKLMHIHGKKVNRSGNTPLFYQSNSFATLAHANYELTIPVIVYASGMETIEADDVTKPGPNDEPYIQSVMKAYEVSREQVLNEINLIVNGDTPPHDNSKGMWF